ncbi:GNAT family acetyltransferase [bacterium]|nr:GNAT family acetyltransferase [bacterium]
MNGSINGLEIRIYSETDESAVVELWRLVFPNNPVWNHPESDVRRKLTVQRELFLVATVESVLIGTAMAGYDGHRGWVYYLAVHPDFRRRGIGEALMRRIEDDLTEMGCHKLNLQVRAGNSEVVEFYKKLGYRVEDHTSMGKLLSDGTNYQSVK